MGMQGMQFSEFLVLISQIKLRWLHFYDLFLICFDTIFCHIRVKLLSLR